MESEPQSRRVVTVAEGRVADVRGAVASGGRR